MEIEIFDVYDYLYLPFWRSWWFISFFILLGIGLIAGLFFYIYRKRLKDLNSADKALVELKQLEINPEKAKDFYFILTTIFKKYLEDRYRLSCSSKTDNEVMELLKKQLVQRQLLTAAESVFLGPQLIKFANRQAVTDQMIHDVDACRRFINDTRIEQGA